MRTSNVTRRVRSSVAAEEKKDDHIPVTTSYPGAPKLVRRRRKRKQLFRGSRQMKILLDFSPVIASFLFIVIFLVYHANVSSLTTLSLPWTTPSKALHFSVLLPNLNGQGAVNFPSLDLMLEDDDGAKPDYGQLDNHSDFSNEMEARQILHDRDDPILEHYAPDPNDDWFAGKEGYYYAFDDDEQRNAYQRWNDDEIAYQRHCRRNAFHRDLHLNCNNFHQLDMPRLTLENGVHFVGAGSYRDVFLVHGQTAVDSDMVLKVAEISNDYDYEIYECMRMEGAVASQLSPHPLIVDIYGFCALSMFNEAMMQGDTEHLAAPIYKREQCDETPVLEGPELLPMNNLTATKKVEWALNMVEGISLLHNYEKGMIIHDDVQLVQYMIKSDGNLKLGDFNRAEFALYDEENGEYCKYLNGHGHGDWRAPEEYFDYPLDEKIDIWSLGMNMYVLLTGVYPIYNECDEDKVKKYIKAGTTPFIDARWANHSYAEGELARIVGSCFAFEAKDRPSIKDLILELRAVVDENKRRQSSAKIEE